jgi:hypothetical protein
MVCKLKTSCPVLVSKFPVGSSARIIFDIIPGLETIYKKRVLKEQGRKWLVASYTPEE